MPTNDLLQNFASELSTRLEQFGFRKGPLAIEPDGREKYCTVARLKVAGARSNVFAFQGPYLEGEQALWAGFGSRSVEAIDLLQAGAEPATRFCSIGYDDWDDYVLLPTMMRKVARCQNFAREDYRKDTNWIWLGRYFRPHKAAASKSAAFIAPAARSLLFDDDGGNRVGERRSINRRQVHGERTWTALSGVEDVFAKPRSGHCRHGSVRGPDHWLQTAVWLRDCTY